MITDLFTRVWDTPGQMGESMLEQLRRRRVAPWSDVNAGEEAHREAMTPVHYAVVHGMVSRRLGAEMPVERVAGLVSRDPQRLLGFAGIDPLDETTRPAAAVERARQLGMSGVTVSPALQGFHPQHSRALALYEACQAAALPIVFEAGAATSRDAAMEFAQPVLLDAVAREFPDLRIVITGLGDPFVEQTLALMAKHPTVFGELSVILTRPWRLYNALIEAHQLGVMNQLLFGSGFPLQRPDHAIVAIYSASSTAQGTNLPGVPREQLRAVVERDTLGCLGIDTPRRRDLIDSKPALDAGEPAKPLPGPEAEDPAADKADSAAMLEEARR